MEKNPTWMAVVAGAMQRDDGRFLLQRRPLEKHHGGLWEFPGGKIEVGESPRNALVRELNEELTVTIDPQDLVAQAFAEEMPAGGRPGIVILLYTVIAWQGFPVAEPGAEIGWFGLAEADRLALPPLDKALVRSLCE
ncbi:(deoxy)nucleoside triphosphate pyrophosphohydrolase [Tsuneonella sp. YG55]|uniref:8-oxo-dGTP diphosphatase n=1 Tax=Tsuneonella litorea TaxID=2976475 RepID=A0A9X2VZX5_9SPHN|nr:(deoxy)nucleoside triphosphate pyrophosphohydrolase [Tsuneonella litorea]MCT2558246.1 (deoxy)nucleoside triphosphate pyrophosphohydrolase [Tsuneonella litorea]